MLSKIAPRYWALVSLLIWGAVILGFGLIRLDGFGLDEGAAQALLLNWSASAQIATPATILGGPDFRALLFIPLGLYWPGSILAAKVFTLLFVFIGCWILYNWRRDNSDDESALLATGLMLIAPVTLLQADSIGVGPYLLCIFCLGFLIDRKYRASQHQISSLYFVQMLLVAIVITLHPIGLAYPLALAWQWQRDPKSDKQKKQVWIGIGCAALIVTAMQTGWVNLHWFSNPFIALNDAIMGVNPADADPDRGIWGVIPTILLGMVCIAYLRNGKKGLMSNMLLLGSLTGLLVADMAWAYIACAFVLYQGIPLLIALNNRYAKGGFATQRGILMILLVIVATSFMQTNRATASYVAAGVLSPTDELIQRLAIEAQDADKPFLGASQWPARTMIVCKRDVLKLPPASSSGDEQMKNIKGVTHIVFNHRDPNNSALTKNFSEITSATETLSVMEAGVIIKVREHDEPTEDQPAAPLANKPNEQQADKP